MIERVPAIAFFNRYLLTSLKTFMRPIIGADDPPEIQRAMQRFGGKVAVDVGAYDGRTAQRMLKRFERVYAFEPLFNRRLAQIKDERLNVVWKAVSSHPGDETAYLRRDGYMTAYLRRNQLRDGGESDSWGPPTAVKTVPCISLDEFFSGQAPPDFVKVDVEGFEVDVLSGARKLVVRGKTDWFIEIHRESNEGPIRRMFPGDRITTLRHPSYRRGSKNWHEHFWLVVEA